MSEKRFKLKKLAREILAKRKEGNSQYLGEKEIVEGKLSKLVNLRKKPGKTMRDLESKNPKP